MVSKTKESIKNAGNKEKLLKIQSHIKNCLFSRITHRENFANTYGEQELDEAHAYVIQRLRILSRMANLKMKQINKRTGQSGDDTHTNKRTPLVATPSPSSPLPLAKQSKLQKIFIHEAGILLLQDQSTDRINLIADQISLVAKCIERDHEVLHEWYKINKENDEEEVLFFIVMCIISGMLYYEPMIDQEAFSPYGYDITIKDIKNNKLTNHKWYQIFHSSEKDREFTRNVLISELHEIILFTHNAYVAGCVNQISFENVRTNGTDADQQTKNICRFFLVASMREMYKGAFESNTSVSIEDTAKLSVNAYDMEDGSCVPIYRIDKNTAKKSREHLDSTWRVIYLHAYSLAMDKAKFLIMVHIILNAKGQTRFTAERWQTISNMFFSDLNPDDVERVVSSQHERILDKYLYKRTENDFLSGLLIVDFVIPELLNSDQFPTVNTIDILSNLFEKEIYIEQPFSKTLRELLRELNVNTMQRWKKTTELLKNKPFFKASVDQIDDVKLTFTSDTTNNSKKRDSSIHLIKFEDFDLLRKLRTTTNVSLQSLLESLNTH